MKIKSTHELSREYHKLLNREIKQTNSLSTEAIKEIRSATGQGRFAGMKGGESFQKRVMSSSGCESRPAKA